MNTPNRFDQLVAESKATLLVLGNPTLDTFEFLEIGTAEVDAVEPLTKLGWLFVGCIGTDEHGTTKVALAIPFDYAVMERVCRDFAARVKREWFGAAELERIFKLNDPRMEA